MYSGELGAAEALFCDAAAIYRLNGRHGELVHTLSALASTAYAYRQIRPGSRSFA